ncbi:hypothetical protein HAX54_022425 [Datura stramonium]|uniref:Uncharacterized protein n=1 Tax=Datura stramonium TaxID=4076 RepID=A0ABS8S6D8_DATST|nr:hypothetical protein [Datura stramonium]
MAVPPYYIHPDHWFSLNNCWRGDEKFKSLIETFLGPVRLEMLIEHSFEYRLKNVEIRGPIRKPLMLSYKITGTPQYETLKKMFLSEVIIKKRRCSIDDRCKMSAYTFQEMAEKDQMFEQSALCDFGDSTGYDNIIEQNNIGGGTIEPIDIVSISCSGDIISNNDMQQDIDISTSDDIARKLSYEERAE